MGEQVRYGIRLILAELHVVRYRSVNQYHNTHHSNIDGSGLVLAWYCVELGIRDGRFIESGREFNFSIYHTRCNNIASVLPMRFERRSYLLSLQAAKKDGVVSLVEYSILLHMSTRI